MTCRSDSLVVGEVVVRRDAHGRYCLNDLHRAAGLEKRHQPNDFLRLTSTKEIIAAINSGEPRSLPVQTVEGRNGGTYVCKALVYDYAMWISATFRLKVIEAFDAMVRGVPDAPATPQLPGDYIEALEALVVAEKEKLRLSAVNAQQAQQLEAQKPDVDLARRYLGAIGNRCLTDAATALEVPPKWFVRYLLDSNICYRRPQQPGQKRRNRLLPHAEFVAKGYLVNKARLVERQTAEGIVQDDRGQTMVTPVGMAWFFARLKSTAGSGVANIAPALPANPKQESLLAKADGGEPG
ncbi:KilA-N domain-containing protein [Myxococcus virescens]|uniref:Phage antirepressor protein YoqD, KilAC domain n=1 Tax=Myxococcus virescens TaxID=83456 RepID=A0A511HQ63_9BACT|nr:KilA-N domain-containing protein [Myxococcus virescens]GEL75514.1 hypothetical protein MVI01_72980 [Myxococcus virescens]SDD65769.1 Phage antirepressor protein YoqD, KilAC domain [Myxococcus virescens]